jgi:hypothetical protein
MDEQNQDYHPTESAIALFTLKMQIAMMPERVNLPITSMPIPPVPGDYPTKVKATAPVEGNKEIFVRCDRCDKTLKVDVPRKIVLENELELVPVSIVHGNDASKHVLTVFLDPDFHSRRDRVSEVLFVEN